MQSKKHSLIESITNTLVGLVISYITLIIVNHIYNLNLLMLESLEITLIFTIVSVGRNYLVRRFYNRKSGNGKW